ncbi:hypothetical protein [Litoribacter populi]|uniref:hypothetical protein n=1 Tax=Litoribacter populi TaxID=2598460 RepID=UPI00163DCA0B|nr:hypothetical protein [Litoribacter populi]
MIVGGESGHKPRPINTGRVLDILKQREEADKGQKNNKKVDREVHGRTHDDAGDGAANF